jgi:hypothetical protein
VFASLMWAVTWKLCWCHHSYKEICVK